MATRIPADVRNAACNAVVDLLDAGVGAGYVEIRSGTQPATAGTAASGTLLATVTLAATAFGAASSGVATAAAIATVTGAATGTAGWFRAYDGGGTTVIDGAAGVSGSGAEMILSSTAITTGGDVTIDSWTVTMPSGA